MLVEPDLLSGKWAQHAPPELNELPLTRSTCSRLTFYCRPLFVTSWNQYICFFTNTKSSCVNVSLVFVKWGPRQLYLKFHSSPLQTINCLLEQFEQAVMMFWWTFVHCMNISYIINFNLKETKALHQSCCTRSWQDCKIAGWGTTIRTRMRTHCFCFWKLQPTY